MKPELLDLRQLQAFQAVARTSSFTHAARELHLTQSAISHSIKALEEELGCSLFTRVGKKMHISQAGEVLLDQTQTVFAALYQAREAVKNLSAWGRGRLRVGASVTICHYIVTSVIREFRECFPDAELVIDPMETYESHTAIMDNRLDLAITLPPTANDNLAFCPLFTDELLLVYAPSHPLARNGILQRQELKHGKYMLLSKRNATFDLLLDYLRKERVELGKMAELGSVDAVKDLIKLGMGIGVLPTWTVRKELDDGIFRAISPGRSKLLRRWGVSTVKAFKTNLMAETFIGLCQSAASQLDGSENQKE